VATSTAHRAPPPAEASRPEKDFSLQGRLDAALAPEATDFERDALLYAISRPLPAEASPREHADFLLSLLTEEQSRTLTGSQGRTVKKAATQALLALGYPYALEIPPEAFEQPSRAGFPRDRLSLGKTLIMANALGPAAVFTLLIVSMGTQGDLPLLPMMFLALGASTLLPRFLLLKGREKKSWVLQLLGSAGLVLSGIAVGALSLWLLYNGLQWGRLRLLPLTLIVGGLGFSLSQIVGTYLLHSPRR
jgi:hypothetical protein